jgi:CheY-like chemotaxis protein
MIVDDDALSNTLVTAFLNHAGFRVMQARSGSEALQMIGAEPTLPDLILTDMMMPGMDGGALVEALQASERAKDVPILLLSGLENISELRQRFGAQGYLKKPLHLDQLTTALSRYLN